MRITLWGTRGSIASPAPETNRYGGNTSCACIQGAGGGLLVLDAGTGIRRLGATISPSVRQIDILLTHLHLDHILGLGFFAPLHNPATEVHIWGPASTTLRLRERLSRYLSPPLFPVYVRDLGSSVFFHEVAGETFTIGEFTISSAFVIHPDPTLGFRISTPEGTVTYLPDHEPALGVPEFPLNGEWTSGYELALGADLLMHDSQYSAEEYPKYVGWGHSSIPQALQFAELTRVKHLVPVHHDPDHTDDELDRLFAPARADHLPFAVTPGAEGMMFEL